MNVLLKPELKKFVAEKVKAGQYATVNDLLNEAVAVLREQEQFAPRHEAYLRRELRHGLEQADRREYSDFDAEMIISEERARLASSKKASATVTRGAQGKRRRG